ncbi:hypothetical protein GCM10007094_21670 [Pseudovibrio japonicus]|uniref:Lipoprotein n=2 Tax=Pseudovibrio japonicus TaxID=366534 RepID=A0ABQ3EBK4_9HYPH|nr:hypothetical protein GCM10007094_21670 [Pseudovibrio japonicus]
MAGIVQAQTEEPITAKKIGPYFQLEIHTDTPSGEAKKSIFVMDTGSTGIVGSAGFFIPTVAEQASSTCKTLSYSSSGNTYAGYIIKRDLTFGTPGEAPTKHLKDFPVFAAVQHCPNSKNTPTCSTTPPPSCNHNPKVFMMGVGFDSPDGFSEAASDQPNAANPFLNLVEENGTPFENQNYALTNAQSDSSSIDVYLASSQNPLPNLGKSLTLPLSASSTKPTELVAPLLPFAITSKANGEIIYPPDGPKTARILPDTGISFGIVSVAEAAVPCCTSSADSGQIETSDYQMQLYTDEQSKDLLVTLSYGKDQPLGNSARWSLGHTGVSPMLFNSGQQFFEHCNYFYSPADRQVTLSCASDQ